MCGMTNTTGSGAMDNQRLYDLVRYGRCELFCDGLITQDEYDELAKSHDSVARLEGYDEITAKLSAALRREEVLREALKRVKGIISPYSVANHHIDDALSVSPAAKDPQNSRIVELESALNRLRAMAQCYGVTEKWTRQEVLETCHRALRGDNDQTIAALSACDEGRK